MNTKRVGLFFTFMVLACFTSLSFANEVQTQKLWSAAQSDSLEGVKDALSKGAKLTKREGSSLVHIAIRNRNTEMLHVLLKYGAEVNFQSRNVLAPLFIVSRIGYEPMVKVLLAYGADVNLVNRLNQTALMYAAHNGHSHIVKILLAHGADKSIVSVRDKTALQIALERGYVNVVNLLVSDEDLRDLHAPLVK